MIFTSWELQRSALYILQTGLMLAFLLVELLIDYILKVDFRRVRWMVISYVPFFFAATGGMIGVAALTGRGWMIAAVILYLIMGALAFLQRRVTGL